MEVITADSREKNKKKIIMIIVVKVEEFIGLAYHQQGTDSNINAAENEKIKKSDEHQVSSLLFMHGLQLTKIVVGIAVY